MKNILKNPLFPLQDKKPLTRVTLALIPAVVLWIISPYLPPLLKQTPAVLHYPVVFFAAWLGGLIPGLISIVISILFAVFIFKPQILNYPVTDFPNVSRVFIFISTSLVFVFMLDILRKALEKANEAVAVRDDFLSLISHELKTPLTALKLNLNIIQQIQTEENPDSFSNNQIESSIRQVNRLERLIVAMMDLTLFDSGQLILLKREICLKKLIQDVVSSMENDSIGITPYQGPLMGNWDQVRVEQIISNVVHNAIKYGHGKPIRIEMGQEQNSVWFSVRDQGPGIDVKDHKRIFKRFQRANTCTDVQGLGLGLYLTKKLVEVHEGEISLVSKPGEGSLFKVLLPVSVIKV